MLFLSAIASPARPISLLSGPPAPVPPCGTKELSPAFQGWVGIAPKNPSPPGTTLFREGFSPSRRNLLFFIVILSGGGFTAGVEGHAFTGNRQLATDNCP